MAPKFCSNMFCRIKWELILDLKLLLDWNQSESILPTYWSMESESGSAWFVSWWNQNWFQSTEINSCLHHQLSSLPSLIKPISCPVSVGILAICWSFGNQYNFYPNFFSKIVHSNVSFNPDPRIDLVHKIKDHKDYWHTCLLLFFLYLMLILLASS